MSDNHSAAKGKGRLTVLALLLAAWGLLLFRLDTIPPGFQHDQMFNTLDALDVLSGRFQLYFPANFGREPLGIYLSALSIGLSGGNVVWGLRFGTVMAGMAALAATFVLARRYLTYGGALLATALLAGSFWFIFTARLGLEPMLVVPLATIMLYLLNRGMARGSTADLALAGLAGAAAVYSYPAGRVLFAVAPLMLLHELIVGWWAGRRAIRAGAARPKRAVGGLALSWTVMLAACAPLFWYVRANASTADRRLEELGGPLSAALRGDLAPVASKIAEAASSIVWAGSQAIPYHYNIPGRPALQPVLATLFLIGVGATIAAWARGDLRHKAAEFLMLIGLSLGMAPVALTGADALHMRGVAALPLLFLLAARGAAWVGRQALRLLRRAEGGVPGWAPAALAATALALVVYQWIESGQVYFVRWANAEPTQRVYNADWRAAAKLLTISPSVEPAFIGTDRLLDLDRKTYLLYGPVRRDARWFHLPGNPPLPANGGARYLMPGNVALPPALAILADRATLDQTLPGSADEYVLLRDLRLSADAVDAALDARAARPPESIPDYSETLRLTRAGAQDGGAQLDLVTEWEVAGPWPFQPPPGGAPTPPKLSASLYDPEGYRWAQADSAAAMPYRTWQVGDRLLETSTLPLPGDIPPGEYEVRLAVYDDQGGVLPVRLDAASAASDPVIYMMRLAAEANRGEAPAPPYPVETSHANEALRPLGRWEPLERLASGAPADLHVSWQVGDRPLDTAGLRFELRATDPAGKTLWEQTADPIQPLPKTWPAGQTYRLAHRITPETPEAGEVEATLVLCAEENGEALACATVGRPRVVNRPPVTALPASPQQTSGAMWEETLALAGYDLGRAGDNVTLTLYWRVAAPPDAALRRFVHAVDPAGAIVAQSDAMPENGGLPMAAWRAGEYVTDAVMLTIPAGAEVATLRVGWYDPATGARLPVSDADGMPLPEASLGIAAP